MALKIRLRQQGRNNRQSFRLVVMNGRNHRDGKYIEKLGWYDPLLQENNMVVNEERILHWLNQGAEISIDAKNLVRKAFPKVIQQLNDKQRAKKEKLAAKRRQLRRAKVKKEAVAKKETVKK